MPQLKALYLYLEKRWLNFLRNIPDSPKSAGSAINSDNLRQWNSVTQQLNVCFQSSRSDLQTLRS